MAARPPTLLNFGGGVNSTAMLIGMLDRGEPVDAVVFANTGGEKPGTMEHLDLVDAWLAARDLALIVRVQVDGIDKTLEESSLRKSTLPSIAFGYKTCSQRWKADPIRKFIRSRWPDTSIVQCLGYDAGEPHRAIKGTDKDRFVTFRYPLIEWGWHREHCVEAIKRAGLPVPPKSACFYCPSSSKSEVLKLRDEHPDLFARAIAMEDKAKPGLGPTVKGLGRNFSWRDLAEADASQMKFYFADPLPCACYDDSEDESVPIANILIAQRLLDV